MKGRILLLTIMSFLLMSVSCEKEKRGCTEPNAINYDSEANINDNSCIYTSNPSSNNNNNNSGTTQCTTNITFYNNTWYTVTVYIGTGGDFVLINPSTSFNMNLTGVGCLGTSVYFGTVFQGYGTNICPCANNYQSYTIN